MADYLASMNEKGYYHVYSFGEDTPRLLTNEREFVIAINILAICTTLFDVRVQAFVLMNSHFHLVLYGAHDECKRMGEELMRRILRKINTSRSIPYIAHKVDVSVDEIADSEQLMRVIIYVIRNPVEAGFKLDPRYYKWSSASLYYAPREQGGELINRMSQRAKMKTMGVYYKYPEDWTIDNDGAVNARHFTDYEGVENIFGGIRRYIAFMFIKKDMLLQLNMACSKTNFQSLSDEELEKAANDLAIKNFKKGYSNLDVVDRIKLAQKLRSSRGTGISQLARVLEINPSTLASIIV